MMACSGGKSGAQALAGGTKTKAGDKELLKSLQRREQTLNCQMFFSGNKAMGLGAKLPM